MLNKVVIKESLYYLVGNVFTQVVTFLIIYVLMRRFSLETYGIYSYVTEYITIFSYFSDAGLTTYSIREVSADPASASEKYKKIQGAQISISVVIFICSLIISGFVNGDRYLLYIVVNAFGLACNSLFNPCTAQLIAFHEKELLFKRNVLDSLGMLLFLGIGVVFHFSLLYFVSLLFIRALINLVFYAFLKYKSRLYLYFGVVKLNTQTFIEVLKGGGYFTLLSASTVVYNKIDVLMLDKFLGPEKVGTFAGASKFVYPFLFISAAVSTAVYPRMVRSFVNKSGFKKNVTKTLSLTTLIGLVMSLGLYFGSNFIFSILFGHKYDESIGVFKILVWNLLIIFMYAPISNALSAAGKVKQLVIINVIVLLIKVVANLYAISHYQVLGAAVSSFLCELFILLIVLYMFFFKKIEHV